MLVCYLAVAEMVTEAGVWDLLRSTGPAGVLAGVLFYLHMRQLKSHESRSDRDRDLFREQSEKDRELYRQEMAAERTLCREDHKRLEEAQERLTDEVRRLAQVVEKNP